MDYDGRELIDIYIGLFEYRAIATYCLTRLRNQ